MINPCMGLTHNKLPNIIASACSSSSSFRSVRAPWVLLLIWACGRKSAPRSLGAAGASHFVAQGRVSAGRVAAVGVAVWASIVAGGILGFVGSACPVTMAALARQS